MNLLDLYVDYCTFKAKLHLLDPSNLKREELFKLNSKCMLNTYGYSLDKSDYEDSDVFWFCEECNSFLNNQDGFDPLDGHHICEKCGHENDVSFKNAKTICIDCGRFIKATYGDACELCRITRKEKTVKNLKQMGLSFAALGIIIPIVLHKKGTNQ